MRNFLGIAGMIVTAAQLAGCTGAGAPVVVSRTPASIEIACVGGQLDPKCASPQAVADIAENHCAGFGLVAQQSALRTSVSGNRWVTFICVPRRG